MIPYTLNIDTQRIIDLANHTTWRRSKEYVVEPTEDKATNTASEDIKYSDILYNVDYTTWKVAKVRIQEPDIQFEAQTDNENITWFRRQYKAALEQVTGLLRNFIILGDIKNDSDYTLKFRFPDTFTGSTAAIAEYARQYIENHILYKWFNMTIPADANAYQLAAEDWKTKMVEEANKENRNDTWAYEQIKTAVAHVAGRLKWCVTKNETGLSFSFPDRWRGDCNALSEYIHSYIVDYILYEWFKMTVPNEAATYLASATDWEDKIINEARSEDVRNVFFRL